MQGTIDTIYFSKSTHSWLFLAYRQNKHKTNMQGFFHTYSSTHIQSKRSMITKRRDENNVMADGTPHSSAASVLWRARLKHPMDIVRVSTGSAFYHMGPRYRNRRLPASALTDGRRRSSSCLVVRTRASRLVSMELEMDTGVWCMRILYSNASV